MVEKVNASFDEYRMYEAADLIYHFIWDEYCDWYLEFSKSDLASPDTRAVLKLTLLRILQLLHPFMPFISEEIYQKIKTDKEFLIQTEFPAFSGEFVFPEAHAAIETLKKVVAETRKTRTENRIEPNKKIPVFLKCDAPAERRHLEKHLKYFDFLSRSSEDGDRRRFFASAQGLPRRQPELGDPAAVRRRHGPPARARAAARRARQAGQADRPERSQAQRRRLRRQGPGRGHPEFQEEPAGDHRKKGQARQDH